MVMEPDIFLVGSDLIPLTRALTRFANKIRNPEQRLAIFSLACVDDDFSMAIDINAAPATFGTTLAAEFKDFRVSDQQLDYHPLINFLKYIIALRPYRIDDADAAFFRSVIAQGQENFKALAVRRAVGRLESPLEHPIGTGVLVAPDLLLTCSHVFDETTDQPLWVRFSYKQGRGDVEPGKEYKLACEFIKRDRRADYALLKVSTPSALPHAMPFRRQLSRDYLVHLIHHPLGRPLEVSDAGRIVDVGEDYIYHTIPAEDGSSGAPIFDKEWHLVAIHLGNPGLRRTPPAGAMTGFPLTAFWDTLG